MGFDGLERRQNRNLDRRLVELRPHARFDLGYKTRQVPEQIILGISVIYKAATIRGFIRSWERIVEDKLVKHHAFDEEGAEDLLHFMEGYGLVRLIVSGGSQLEGKSVADLREAAGKVTVLGIERGKTWLPNPKGTEVFVDGDRIVVYGNLEILNSLSF